MNADRSAFAVLTPPGCGGIAVIRCVGPAVAAAIARCFRPAGRTQTGTPSPGGMPPAHSLAYGHILDADGHTLDEVILYHAGPAAFEPAAEAAGDSPSRGTSPAAEDAPPLPQRAQGCAYEINCHGGPAAVAAVGGRLADLCLEPVDADTLLEIEGAAPIERAARRALRTARTPTAARVLLDQLNGALAAAVGRILDDLNAGRAADAQAALAPLLAAWQTCGRFLADPPRIVIAGRPNAGKSTLMNRLVGSERVLTSPAPGTTRDYVEADAALEGLPVVLVDTAGLRDAAEEVERAGVQRAHAQAAAAAVVVYLLDATVGRTDEDDSMLSRLGDRALAVWNKVDAAFRGGCGDPPRDEPAVLPSPHGGRGVGGEGTSSCGGPALDQQGVRSPNDRAPDPLRGGGLALSAATGQGLDALTRAVLDRLGYRAPAPGDAVPFTPEQAAALENARNLLAAGRAAEARQTLARLLNIG